MEIFPAIDIRKGKCTQLVGGKFGTERFMIGPLKIAKRFQVKNINRIHIVDLDSAKNTGDNINTIKKLVKNINIDIEVGGGIRSVEKAKEIINLGAKKIIVGTKAIQDPYFVSKLGDEIGKEKIIISLDSKNRKIAINGWEKTTDLEPIEMAKKLQNYCSSFLLTCIEKEGLMEGLDIEYIKKFVKEVKKPLIASGGVGSLEDIKKLKDSGVYAVVIGTAIYLKKFKIKEAVKLAK